MHGVRLRRCQLRTRVERPPKRAAARQRLTADGISRQGSAFRSGGSRAYRRLLDRPSQLFSFQISDTHRSRSGYSWWLGPSGFRDCIRVIPVRAGYRKRQVERLPAPEIAPGDAAWNLTLALAAPAVLAWLGPSQRMHTACQRQPNRTHVTPVRRGDALPRNERRRDAAHRRTWVSQSGRSRS